MHKTNILCNTLLEDQNTPIKLDYTTLKIVEYIIQVHLLTKSTKMSNQLCQSFEGTPLTSNPDQNTTITKEKKVRPVHTTSAKLGQ